MNYGAKEDILGKEKKTFCFDKIASFVRASSKESDEPDESSTVNGLKLLGFCELNNEAYP